eukprot:m.100250 g.100250  ORF g.100250 m.100250 type:complete len:314 (+) comp8745_c0_seq2:719-1660(+)
MLRLLLAEGLHCCDQGFALGPLLLLSRALLVVELVNLGADASSLLLAISGEQFISTRLYKQDFNIHAILMLHGRYRLELLLHGHPLLRARIRLGGKRLLLRLLAAALLAPLEDLFVELKAQLVKPHLLFLALGPLLLQSNRPGQNGAQAVLPLAVLLGPLPLQVPALDPEELSGSHPLLVRDDLVAGLVRQLHQQARNHQGANRGSSDRAEVWQTGACILLRDGEEAQVVRPGPAAAALARVLEDALERVQALPECVVHVMVLVDDILSQGFILALVEHRQDVLLNAVRGTRAMYQTGARAGVRCGTQRSHAC